MMFDVKSVIVTTIRKPCFVLNSQLFKALAAQIPKQVTGLLQARGPMDASYEWQYWLEHHSAFDIPASGFSLDLLKCFNTIDQDQALHILLSLGLPSCVLAPWIATIRRLNRVWILGTSCSQPVSCSRGFPEGDTFSVVVMICIGHLWTFAVSQISDRVKASAYADNWGWATLQPRLHSPILQLTADLVKALGMIIDWKKFGCGVCVSGTLCSFVMLFHHLSTLPLLTQSPLL